MQQYISLLKKNDSAKISDALDSLGIEGALLGISAIQPGLKIVAPAFTVQYQDLDKSDNSFHQAGNYIDLVPEGYAVVIDNHGRVDCTTWGDILTQFSIKKRIAGTIINGAARDISTIKKLSYPLFTKGIYMRSGKNRVRKICHNQPINIGNITIEPNDIIFADDNGVIVIPKKYIPEVAFRANNIHQTELKILEAVNQGMELKEARETFHYEKPWKSNYT